MTTGLTVCTLQTELLSHLPLQFGRAAQRLLPVVLPPLPILPHLDLLFWEGECNPLTPTNS